MSSNFSVLEFCVNIHCGHHLQDEYLECGCGPIHRWDYGACCYAKIRDHTVKTDGAEEILSFLSIFIVKAVGMFDYFNGFLDDVSATSERIKNFLEFSCIKITTYPVKMGRGSNSEE